MNYIKRLQGENEELKQQLAELNQDLTNFMAYLSSDKFQGPMNDFVNSNEVYQRLAKLRMQTLTD